MRYLVRFHVRKRAATAVDDIDRRALRPALTGEPGHNRVHVLALADAADRLALQNHME